MKGGWPGQLVVQVAQQQAVSSWFANERHDGQFGIAAGESPGSPASQARGFIRRLPTSKAKPLAPDGAGTTSGCPGYPC